MPLRVTIVHRAYTIAYLSSTLIGVSSSVYSDTILLPSWLSSKTKHSEAKHSEACLKIKFCVFICFFQKGLFKQHFQLSFLKTFICFVWEQRAQHMCWDQRKSEGVDSLLSQCGFWGSNIGCQAWQQGPWPLSHMPVHRISSKNFLILFVCVFIYWKPDLTKYLWLAWNSLFRPG